MWKVVIALCLFSGNGELLEHTLMKDVGECLEKKRIMKRNMNNSVNIVCGEVEAEIEVLQGKEFIKSIRKKG
tara:strand:- start:609 stop:824 length:216 start_codon:yes stop_codon:yes gene_type:complete